MSPTTVFLFSIPVFILIMFIPIFVLMYLAVFKHVRKLTCKQALVTWACIIIYYSVFFTQVPKITRPYFAQHSHQVTECQTRTVWDE